MHTSRFQWPWQGHHPRNPAVYQNAKKLANLPQTPEDILLTFASFAKSGYETILTIPATIDPVASREWALKWLVAYGS